MSRGVSVKLERKSRRLRQLEELRQALPVETYLAIMHEAAMTGFVPSYDPRTHKPLSTQHQQVPLAPKEQLEVLRFLIDKALPTPKAIEAAPPTDPDSIQDERQRTKLTREQLHEIVDAEFDMLAAPPPPDQDQQSA